MMMAMTRNTHGLMQHYPGELLICPEFRDFPVSCDDAARRDLLILFIHLLTTVARLVSPGSVRSVVAESVLVKRQLLILNRSRDRRRAGLCRL